MDHKYEAVAGSFAVTLGSVSELLHTISPFISFIAILTGAILGCHGVYYLIKNWWNGKNTPPTHPPYNF